MLTAYRDEGGGVRDGSEGALPDAVIWIDLRDPSEAERALVEARAGVALPSRADLSEIEATSRLRIAHDVVTLSTPVVSRGGTAEAELSPVGFVLSRSVLVTVRYTDHPVFDAVAERVRQEDGLASAEGVFVAFLEAIVDRGADVLERIGTELDQLSRTVFRGDTSDPRHAARSTSSLRRALGTVGALGERLSQARDVLLGVGRIVGFTQDLCQDWFEPPFHRHLEAVGRDVTSLNDYEAHLSGKVQFLLDAVLGYITIEQNDLFKILTIASVVGVPPTLLVGIWGMNFKMMPELEWPWGYPMALVLVVVSAVIPLMWFKLKGWF